MSYTSARIRAVELPTLGPPSNWWLAALGVLLAVDIAQTTIHWSLEANPIVLELGRFGHVVAKAVGFACYGVVFITLSETVPRTSYLSVTGLTALYSVVVVTNMMVILA